MELCLCVSSVFVALHKLKSACTIHHENATWGRKKSFSLGSILLSAAISMLRGKVVVGAEYIYFVNGSTARPNISQFQGHKKHRSVYFCTLAWKHRSSDVVVEMLGRALRA